MVSFMRRGMERGGHSIFHECNATEMTRVEILQCCVKPQSLSYSDLKLNVGPPSTPRPLRAAIMPYFTGSMSLLSKILPYQ